MEIKQEISIVKRIIKLSLPVMMGEIMFSILSFVDRFYIAKLGINEAAGSSLSSTIVWVLIALSTLITGGTIALVSRMVGEKNEKGVTKSAEQSMLLALFLGLFLGGITYLFSADIIGFFNAEPVVERLGIEYFSILLLGYPLIMIGSTSGVIFQSSGNTKTPMLIFTGMSIMNIILDPMLIFGFDLFSIPAMGVRGAALATVISELVACTWIAVLLYRDKKLKLNFLSTFIPDFVMIKRILKIGMWSGMNSLSRPLSAIFLQKIITFHGTYFVAAFSFGIQWISIVFIFMQGMRVAISTLVGQFLGQNNHQGAEDTTKAGLQFGYVFIAIIMAIGMPLSKYAISIFTADSTVIEAGSWYLIIVLAGMLFEVPMTVYAAGFNGAGDTAPPTIIAFFSNWVGKIGFAAIATYYFDLGINWVWFAITLSLIIEGIGLSIWFKRGKWKHKTV
ncbi:MAG: MATE family efflux transporter [Candidatus Delongbacteria bacterium]|nr:MATE family efflux transporter [Candidatus Delongbacteria bacterium]